MDTVSDSVMTMGCKETSMRKQLALEKWQEKSCDSILVYGSCSENYDYGGVRSMQVIKESVKEQDNSRKLQGKKFK